METLNQLTFNFNLREPRAKRETPLYLVVKCEGKQIKIATGLKVLPLVWNKHKQHLEVSPQLNDVEREKILQFNSVIFDLVMQCNRIKLYLCTNQVESVETYIKDTLKIETMARPRKQTTKKTNGKFAEQLQGLINEFSKERQRKYRKLITDLLDYMTRKKIAMKWQSITKEMIYNFICYLVSDGKEYQIKTFNEKINDMFFVLNHADNHDYLTNYKKQKWSKLIAKISDDRDIDEKQSANIILTEEQIDKLCNHDFKDGKKNEVRDIYTLLCLTSLGSTDFLQIWHPDFCTKEDDNTISIKRNKTKTECQIPLHDPRAKAIYNRYKNGFPSTQLKGVVKDGKLTMRVQDNSLLNKILKQIIREVGFDENVEVTRSYVTFKSGKLSVVKRKEVKPLCEEISLYDGRHTFITLMYYEGMPKELLKQITGHTTDEMIDRYYLKYDSDKEKAQKRAEIAKFYKSKGSGTTTATPPTNDADTKALIAQQAIENFTLKVDKEISDFFRKIDSIPNRGFTIKQPRRGGGLSDRTNEANALLLKGFPTPSERAKIMSGESVIEVVNERLKPFGVKYNNDDYRLVKI